MNLIRYEQGASLLENGEACSESCEQQAALSMSKTGLLSLLVWLRQAGSEGLMWKMRELLEDRTEFMTTGSEEPASSSQSAHSSNEAGNDRGAKGRRKEKL